MPIFDTGFVIAKRIKYRRPIYQADRWHLHHRMANLGFSQRRTLAYLYAWALVMAGLALAFRFVPYSDDRGNFDAAWTTVMIGCLLLAVAASVYLVIVARDPEAARRARQLATPAAPPWPEPRSTRGSRASSRPELRRRRPQDRRTEFDASPPVLSQEFLGGARRASEHRRRRRLLSFRRY